MSFALPCYYCDGTGEVETAVDVTPSEENGGMSQAWVICPCEHCDGTGAREADGGDYQEDGDY